MAINYTGVDLDRYNAGNKFYSQDRFLQGIGLDKPAITFNPSQSNTGIMSAYNYNPYPIIPPSDGEGYKGPGRTDYGYTGPGSTGSPEGFDIDVIGEGTIDDVDMPKGPGLSLMDMVRAGGAFMVGGPFNTMSSLNKSSNRNKQTEIDEINERINAQYGTPSDESGSINYGGSGYEGMTDAESDKERSEGGRGKRAEGGRIGYNGGGVTNYKNFLVKKGYKDMMQGMSDNEIRGLYDSVMGTFSLRRAYGGIVGMYR